MEIVVEKFVARIVGNFVDLVDTIAPTDWIVVECPVNIANMEAGSLDRSKMLIDSEMAFVDDTRVCWTGSFEAFEHFFVVVF